MRLFVGLLFLFPIFYADAKSGSLVLSGVVPLKAEIKMDPATKTFSSLSSPQLKVEVQKRKIASIIRVSAP